MPSCSLLVALVSLIQASGHPVDLPDTPAAKQLSGFLAAFNSGSREKLRAFIGSQFEPAPNASNFVENTVAQQMGNFSSTSGFIVRKVVESSSAMIRVLAQAKSTGVWTEISFFVTARAPEFVEAIPPYQVVGMGLRTIEAPAEFVERTRLSESQIRNRVDAMMKPLVANDAFSGTVTVAKNGRILYARAFGLASRAWNVRNRVDTKFNLASVTKMFTAVAVAQLVERGKLSFSETVGEALSDYPNHAVASSVTIGQLLSHTSGLIGAGALIDRGPTDPSLRTIPEMVKTFVDDPLSFPPGQRFDYSNAGFILLGLIVERASGQSYYDYVRDHVFRPAGMKDTDFYELDADPHNLAEGFEDGPGGRRRNNIFALGVKGSPAGGAYSTGLDMVRFAQALTSGVLIKRQTAETLWAGVTEQDGGKSKYGYGATISRTNGIRVISHGGGWRGITNHFAFLPETGYSIVVLSNYDDDPNGIDYRIREWVTQGAAAPK